MDGLFKNVDYDRNFNSLIQILKLEDTKQIDEQYDKTVRDLSRALGAFTSKAEDVAKFVICTDLNNYVEPVDKRPLGLFRVLKGIRSGRNAPVKKDNIRNFAQSKLQGLTMNKAAEYTNILGKINRAKEGRSTVLKEILDSGLSEKEEHKPHEVNLESATTSKQKEEEQPKTDMGNLFKSASYNRNFSSLIQILKLEDTKQIDEQYDKTVRDLSRALRAFTSKAEDVAKFVICTDLNNYVEPVDKRPLGLFRVLKGIRLGRNAPVKKDNIRNFAQSKLQGLTMNKAAEYTNILGKINRAKEGRSTVLKEILDSGLSEKEEHKPHEVNLESATTSKQKEEEQPKKESAINCGKGIKRPAPPPTATVPNELRPKPQKGIATTEKKVRFKSKPEIIFFDDSEYGCSSDDESDKKISDYQEEELICTIVPKEHIEAKRGNKQQQKFRSPKPKSADQRVSTKPRIVGFILKKSAESKPTVPLKSESQGCRQSAQGAAGRTAPEVKVVAVKEGVNGKKDGRVRSMVRKIEQNQAADSKATPAPQADIGVEKNSPKAASQSHSFPARNERSKMNPTITAKSDHKPLTSKNPPLTQVSVKEMAVRFERYGKK